MNKHIRFVSISASRIPSEYIEVRENLFIKLLLLFEEGTVKGMCRLIVEEFEAVEDLDGASSLDTNHATVNPIITITITNTNTITITIITGLLHLRLNPSVVIRYVHYHQWMQFECQSTARSRRRCHSQFSLLGPHQLWGFAFWRRRRSNQCSKGFFFFFFVCVCI